MNANTAISDSKFEISQSLTQVKIHLRVENGYLLSAKNAYRIQVRSTVATDLWGNQLDKAGRSPVGAAAPYFQTFRMVHHRKKGFAFVEVSNGYGMGSFHPNVRGSVIRALMSSFGDSKYVVDVLPKDCQMPGPLPVHRYASQPDLKDWFYGAEWCKPADKAVRAPMEVPA